MGMSSIWKKAGYLLRVLSGVRRKALEQSLDKARERSGKNRGLLFLDMLWCAWRYGAGYHDYVMFGFYDMDGRHRDTYVTRLRNKRLITLLNDPETAEIFDHKTRFDPRFRDYLGREFLLTQDMGREELRTFLENRETCFFKPDVGESGKGVHRLRTEDFAGVDEMFDLIKGLGPGVLEGELRQHEAMTRLYPHAVNTLRIVTLLAGEEPGHYVPHCVYAVVKAGAGGKFVDNLENGGLFCPVDPETGAITGVGHTAALTTLERHPDTGVELMGYKIPYVREAIALCKQAALEEPAMRFVGWDVAITAQGPVIVEGNDYPGYDFWQQPEHTPERMGLWPYYKRMIPELK